MKNYTLKFEKSCQITYQYKSATKALKLFYNYYKKEIEIKSITQI